MRYLLCLLFISFTVNQQLHSQSANFSYTANVHLAKKKATEHKPDSTLFYNWNVNTSTFNPVFYRIYTYDPLGNLSIERTKTIAGQWNESILYGMENGHVVSILTESFDTVQQLFVPVKKEEMNYDNYGNRTSRIQYTYNSQQQLELTIGDSVEMIYDQLSRAETMIEKYFEISQQLWIPTLKYQLDYNGNNTSPQTVTGESWNNSTQQWDPLYKVDELQYGLGFKNIFESFATLYYSYSWDGSSYNPGGFDSLAYSNNRVDAMYSYSWNGTQKTPYNRSVFTYDNEGNQFTRVYDLYQNNAWITQSGIKDSTVYGSVGQVLESYRLVYSNSLGATWKPESKYQNFFAPGLNVRGIPNSEFLIYPNPAKGSFNIKNEKEQSIEIRITTLEGSLVYKQTTSDNQHKINADSWPAGIYIINIKTPQGISADKLLIR